MARLTWQNVSNPNLGGLGGFKAASGMLDSALTGLRGSLGDYQKDQQQLADASVLSQMLQYNDPEAFNKAISSGSLFGNINPRQLSGAALEALGNRSGTLLSNASTQQRLDHGAYDHTRKVEGDERMDAFRPVAGEALLSAAQGRENYINALSQSPEFLALSPTEQASFIKSTSGLTTEDLGRRSTRQSMSQSAADFANRQTAFKQGQSDRERKLKEKEISDEINKHLVDVYPNANNPEQLSNWVTNLDAPVEVRAGLMKKIDEMVPGVFEGTVASQELRRAQAKNEADIARINAQTGKALADTRKASSSGSGVPSTSDSDLSLRQIYQTATNSSSMRNSTPNSLKASIFQDFLGDDSLKTEPAVVNKVVEYTNLSQGDAEDAIADIVERYNVGANVAGGIVAMSTRHSKTPMTDMGDNHPILGASLGEIAGIPLNLNRLSPFAQTVNSIGNMIMGRKKTIDPAALKENTKAVLGTHEDASTVLSDATARITTQDLPQRLINAQRRHAALYQKHAEAVATGAPEEEINELAEQVNKANQAILEINQKLKAGEKAFVN